MLEVAAWVKGLYLMSIVPLGLAWIASHLLYRQRASVRHHVWTISLAIALLSPPVTLVTPKVNVPVPQAFGRLSVLPVQPEDPMPSMRTHPLRDAPITSDNELVRRCIRTGFVIWLTGALVLLLLRLRARLRLARLCHKARMWNASEHIGIDEGVVVPMLAGVIRPMILLPRAATEWAPQELEALLTHERAHLARRDHMIAVMCDLATALYWVNPLIWVAARAVEYERELACDDEVLRAGVKPSVYANALICISETLPISRRIAGGLAITGSRLYLRIRHVLRHEPHGSGVTPLSWGSTLLIVVLCTIGITGLRAVAAAPYVQTDEVVAIVNGESLTVGDIDRHQADAVAAVDEILVVQRGKDMGFGLSEAQFASVVDNIKRHNRLETDEQFHAAMTQQRLTPAALRRRLERELIVSRVRHQETSVAGQVTESAARAYYVAHPDEFPRTTLEQARDVVNDRIAAVNREQVWESYLESLRSQALIDWKSTGAKHSYDDGLIQRKNMRK